MGLVVVRSLAYLAMCSDSISRRRNFLYALLFTSVAEICLFVVINFSLVQEERAVQFSALENMGFGASMQVIVFEVLSAIHMIMSCYFSVIAHEYYNMARDDPAMIDREHKILASKEKQAAKDRKNAKIAKQKKNDEQTNNEQEIEQVSEPLLDNEDPNVHVANARASKINTSLNF